MATQQRRFSKMAGAINEISLQDNWSLLECDSRVFTELVRGLGVTGVQVEEMWSLDKEEFDRLRPIHGFIFLYEWEDEEPSGPIVKDSRLERIFFAKQFFNNTCSTQALLNILLNCDHPHVFLGEMLSGIKEFCATFDANMKGLALSNSEPIKEVHNSFARQTLFRFKPRRPKKNEEYYHYIAYIAFEGRLYELDALRDGPIDLGTYPTETDWLDAVRPIMVKRMKRCKDIEIPFRIMAVVSDRKSLYERRIEEVENLIDESGMDTDNVQAEISTLRLLIEDEEERAKQNQMENIRRRHNYMPLFVEFMKLLINNGNMLPLYERAKHRALIKEATEDRKFMRVLEAKRGKVVKRPTGNKRSRVPKRPRQPKRPRTTKRPRQPKRPKEPKTPREPRRPREPKTPREPKKPREPKIPREPKTPREPKRERTQTMSYMEMCQLSFDSLI